VTETLGVNEKHAIEQMEECIRLIREEKWTVESFQFNKRARTLSLRLEEPGGFFARAEREMGDWR
jgi:hypothetical protein